MNRISINKTASLVFIFLVSTLFITTSFAQTVYQSQALDIRLTGTSNIHDWEMKTVKGSGEAALTVDAGGKLTSITNLSFSLPATSLKSEHKVMDKNTYRALNTGDNPNISFVLTSGTVTPTGDNNYKLNCIGKLTIAGKTNQTELVATGKYNPEEKTFIVIGVKKMKMTDYNVKPPKALMGTIKTGDEISISYNVKFIK